MIIYFNDLSAVKKEAVFLRKAFKKHSNGQKISLSYFQDIVAKMYGWENYNRLSQSHEINLKLEDSDINISYISTLSIKERRMLEIQKKSILLSSLKLLDSKSTEVIFSEFFNKKSKRVSFFEKSKVKDISSLSDLSINSWKYGTMIHSENKDFITNFILDIPMNEAIIDVGGTFIVRESISNDIFSYLDFFLDDKERLKVFYAGRKNDFSLPINKSSYPLIPLDGDISDNFSLLNILESLSSININNSPMFRHSHFLFDVMHEDDFNIDKFRNSLSADNFFKKSIYFYKNQDENEQKIDKIKKLHPIFHERFFIQNDTSLMSTKEIEYLGYLFMDIIASLDLLSSYPYANNKDLELSDYVLGDFINIIVIPDSNIEGISNYDSLIIDLIKSTILPILNSSFKGKGKNEISKPNYFKPIFIDSSFNISSTPGINIFMAQLRTFGFSSFFVLNKYSSNAFYLKQEEKFSMIANTKTKIFMGDDFIKNISDIIDYQDSFDSALKNMHKSESIFNIVNGKAVIYHEGVIYSANI